jgi:WD40 repeat protein
MKRFVRLFVVASVVCCAGIVVAQDPKVDRYGDALPTGAVARLGTARYRHAHATRAVFLPGTHHVLVGGDSGGVALYDADTGKRLREFPGPAGDRVLDFDLSPDGKSLALVSANNRPGKRARISFFDPASGKETGKPIEHEDLLVVVRFLSDEAVVTGDFAGMLRVFDRMGGEIKSAAVFDDRIESIAVSPSGDAIAAASGGGVALWSWKTDDPPTILAKAFRITNRAHTVAFSPDGKVLAVGLREKEHVKFFETETGGLLWEEHDFKGSGHVTQIAFTPDSRSVAIPVKREQELVELRDAKSGKLIRSFDAPGCRFSATAISDDGELLLAVGRETGFKVWRIATGAPLDEKFAGFRSAVSRIAWSNDGETLVAVSFLGDVGAWKATSGEPIHFARHEEPRPILALAISPDGEWIATSSFDNSVRLWSVDTGKEAHRLLGHGKNGIYALNGAAFSGDGKRLLSFGNDMVLRETEVATGKLLAERPISPGGLEIVRDREGRILILGPDGEFESETHRVLTGASFAGAEPSLLVEFRGAIHQFETATGKEVGVLKCAEKSNGFGASSDGRLLATSENHGASMRLYDVAMRKEQRKIDGGDYRLRAPVVSPDGKLIAVEASHIEGAEPATIQIYDSATGEKVASIGGLSLPVYQAALSPDSTRLAAGQGDGTILIWDLGKRP